jgi:hypothetical protein
MNSGRSGSGGLVPLTLTLIVAASVMGWLTWRAVDTGRVRLVSRSASGTVVLRREKPVLYWANVGTLGLMSLGSLGSALWIVLLARSERRSAGADPAEPD